MWRTPTLPLRWESHTSSRKTSNWHISRLPPTKLIVILSAANTRQIVLSTAHPAKFSEAVSRALEQSTDFDFDRNVLPTEFRGLLQKERRVIDVERPDVELVKGVIERMAKLD